MTDNSIELTRRKILGSVGAIGVAGATAGYGTSAYFSDEETFEDNQMTAGSLDLKVDWQQHYYGPTEQWEFVNAHPDHDDDGEQSIDLGDGNVVKYSDDDRNIVDALDCSTLDENYESNFGDQDSLVSLSDVKPGDEGEITFSLHLCDNPGYIWLAANNFNESGGMTTEPEPTPDNGELAENMNVEFWYDLDCDNKLDRSGDDEGQDLEVGLVSDISGSMSGSVGDLQDAATGFVDELASPDEAAAVSFASGSSLDQELTTDYQAVKDEINAYSAGGTTNMSAGISTAHSELMSGNNATTGANKVMVLLGDGEPDSDSNTVAAADAAKADGIRIFTIALGGADVSFMESLASNPGDAYVAPDSSDLDAIYDEIATEVTSGETIILGKGDGVHEDHVTLAQAMEIMGSNDGMVPLDGTGDMGYGEGPTSEERDCFEAATSYCIGAHWWVPDDVGNEIQGDTVEFDLGFYTEQCRHNDGSGPATQTTTQS